MRVGIVGSRKYPHEDQVRRYVRAMDWDDIVISGACPDSPDEWAADEARQRKMVVVEYPVDAHGLPQGPARRIEYAKRAHARNTVVVDNVDRLVAFWDGESTGTYDTIKKAKKRGIPVVIF